MLEWAARNKVKGLLFMLLQKILQVFLLSVSKSLLTERLLKVCTISIHTTAPAQRAKSSKKHI